MTRHELSVSLFGRFWKDVARQCPKLAHSKCRMRNPKGPGRRTSTIRKQDQEQLLVSPCKIREAVSREPSPASHNETETVLSLTSLSISTLRREYETRRPPTRTNKKRTKMTPAKQPPTSQTASSISSPSASKPNPRLPILAPPPPPQEGICPVLVHLADYNSRLMMSMKTIQRYGSGRAGSQQR